LTPTASLRTITGAVTDSGSTAVVGADVRLVDANGVVNETSTNISGGYSFTNVTPKAGYKVVVGVGHPTLSPVWITSNIRGSISGATGVPTMSFDATTNNLALPTTKMYTPAQHHSIQVTLSNGTGAELRIYDDGGFVASTKTNAAGVYTISGLRPLTGYKVWVWGKCPVGCSLGSVTSEWWQDAPGEQFDQSAKLGSLVDLTSASASLPITLT
jgi:hypothetical protein